MTKKTIRSEEQAKAWDEVSTQVTELRVTSFTNYRGLGGGGKVGIGEGEYKLIFGNIDFCLPRGQTYGEIHQAVGSMCVPLISI